MRELSRSEGAGTTLVTSRLADRLPSKCLFVTNKAMSGMELKAWRKRLGLMQREAAAMLGVSAFTLSAWEIGRFRIKQPGLLALACRMVELQLTQSSGLLSKAD